MSGVFICGAGGLGREVAAMLKAFPDIEVRGFLDDAVKPGTLIDGLRVWGPVESLATLGPNVPVVVAVGDPSLKRKLVDRCHSMKVVFPKLIHPQAICQDEATTKVGEGTIVQAGCILTTAISVGKHVLLNLNCTVGHDTNVGDFSSLMPGVNLAGGVTIGAGVMLGSGVNVINRIRIGDDTIVGAGAVVIRDLPSGVKAVGVPAMIK